MGISRLRDAPKECLFFGREVPRRMAKEEYVALFGATYKCGGRENLLDLDQFHQATSVVAHSHIVDGVLERSAGNALGLGRGLAISRMC